jgi:hypothetical protein
MATTTHHPAACVLALALCLSGGAFAQDDASPAEALRGPSVPDQQTETLVNRTMTGRFVPLEVRPEAAAIQELGLDEATLERAKAVIDERSFAVTMHLVDELDTIREMTDARMDGRPEDAQELFNDLWSSFDENTERSPLIKPLEAVLEPDDAAALRRLVDEYWEAWIDAELGGRMDAGDNARERVARRLALGLFQREVQDSYETSLRRYQQAIEGVSNFVEPTPEQRQEIRMIIIEHIKATRLAATPEQRRQTNLKIYRMLDDERQEKLFMYMTRFVIPDEG